MAWKVKRDPETGEVVFKGDHPVYEDEKGNTMTSDPDTWIFKLNDQKRKMEQKKEQPKPAESSSDPRVAFLQEIGIEDPEDLRELIEAGKSALDPSKAQPIQKPENTDILIKRSVAEAKRDWLRQQRSIELERDRLAAEAKTLKDEREELFGALENQMIDAQGAIAIGERKGRTKLLMRHIKGAVKVIKDDQDGYIPVILDATGQPRMKGDKRFTIGDLVDEMREDPDFAIAFDPDGYNGSITNERGVANSRGKVNRVSPGRVSASDREGFNNSIEDIAAGRVKVVD